MARPSTGQVLERKTSQGKTFAVRFRAYGRREYTTLGTDREGWTRQRAEQELKNILADVNRGYWRPPEPEPAEMPEPAEPTFHQFASEWYERRRNEVDERTAEHWMWALSNHLLPSFKDLRPSQITVAVIEKYKAAKLAERAQRLVVIEEWRKADPARRGPMPPRPLGNASINKTLKIAAQVLDDAVEFGYVGANVARGRRRRLKAEKPKRTWLQVHEIRAVLGAAGKHRALLATMIMSGLRISELCALRWRDVDLAGGTLRVDDSKTEAGERVIDIRAGLLDELTDHKANATFSDPSDYVFATVHGTIRNRSNVTRQILAPTIVRANAALASAGRPPIVGITNHSLRRTYCGLLYELGETPVYVMSQMGHTDPKLALEIYAKVIEQRRKGTDTEAVRKAAEELLNGTDWALMGTSPESVASLANGGQKETPSERGFSELRD